MMVPQKLIKPMLLWVSIALLPAVVNAAQLGGNESLNDGVLSYQGGSITGILAASTRVFSWVGVAGGLDLNGYVVTYFENGGGGLRANNLVLDLWDGSACSAITNGGTISTSWGNFNGGTGDLVLTNAAHISMGTIDTRYLSPGAGTSGSIVIRQHGGFRAATVITTSSVGHSGSIDAEGDDSGGFWVGASIDTSGSGDGGDVSIHDYKEVVIQGGIIACSGQRVEYFGGGDVRIGSSSNPIAGAIQISGGIDGRGAYRPAGNVGLYAIGRIEIAGSIDLCRLDGQIGGSVDLVTANGDIKLGDLDLGLTGAVTFDFRTSCVVTGAVVNFATNHTGGAGTRTDPYVTTQTQLRTAQDKKIMYHPSLGGNAYLAGASYRLADISGAPGHGGILTPYQGRGTVIIIR